MAENVLHTAVDANWASGDDVASLKEACSRLLYDIDCIVSRLMKSVFTATSLQEVMREFAQVPVLVDEVVFNLINARLKGSQPWKNYSPYILQQNMERKEAAQGGAMIFMMGEVDHMTLSHDCKLTGDIHSCSTTIKTINYVENLNPTTS